MDDHKIDSLPLNAGPENTRLVHAFADAVSAGDHAEADRLRDALLSAFECEVDLSAPGSIDRHDNARKKQQGLFQSVGKEGAFSAILLAEWLILNSELEFYGNSQAMRTSIKDALAEGVESSDVRKPSGFWAFFMLNRLAFALS